VKGRKYTFDEHYIPEPNSGCYLWLGVPSGNNGYGRISYNGRRYLAHRLSWILHRGEIPPGLRVLHRCDTPACVNPAHLFLGTQADNVRDSAQKGRHRDLSGEDHPLSKLTESDVRAIFSDPRLQSVIAKDYGISLNTIDRIKHRRGWRHLNL
jgi:hypothetical protein